MVGFIEFYNEGFHFSVFIFVEDRESLMSFTQESYLYFCMSTRSDRVYMSQTIHILRSIRRHFPSILWSDIGSSPV